MEGRFFDVHAGAGIPGIAVVSVTVAANLAINFTMTTIDYMTTTLTGSAIITDFTKITGFASVPTPRPTRLALLP
ncbi:hypothetical protein [Paenibacillus pectinilyticus]|uniref:hypothetical protein n=1 Tax=Paenibacillus pectinilyticus TaxID=512399 RepID=UPI00114C9D55|nr:hypothetical protein [Paenibacillus pectinilyticus]